MEKDTRRDGLSSGRDPRGDVPPVQLAPSFPVITTPILANFKKSLLKQWDQRWASHHHGRNLYRLQSFRDRNSLLKHNGLKRAVSSLIMQMRTGKIALNEFLMSVNKSDTDRCPLCQPRRGAVQSVAHILLECTKFNRVRRDILWQGTGTRNMAEILGAPNLAKRAASFMARTGPFGKLRKTCLAGTEQNP